MLVIISIICVYTEQPRPNPIVLSSLVPVTRKIANSKDIVVTYSTPRPQETCHIQIKLR